MLVRPHPLPDELDRSYLGAVMRFNGLATEAEAQVFMAAWDGSVDLPRRRNPTLKLLSAAAGMELSAFVRSHTTLPLRRSITSYLPDLEHGSNSNPELIHVSGQRSCRNGAYLCQDCVWEDVDFHGRSYWRREHQLPGVYWCAKHRSPLSVVENENAILLPPSQVVSRAARLDSQWVEELQQHRAIGRFLDLCETLMDRPKAYPVVAIRDALRAAARPYGYRSYAAKAGTVCKEPLLSDALLDSFPREWVEQIVPDLRSKKMGEILHQVDGVLWTATSASSAVVYILALTLLFDSTASAIRTIEAAIRVPQTRPRLPRKAIRNQLALEVYVQAQGSHTRLRRDQPDDWYPLVQAQQKMGLPGLPHVQSGELWAAVKAFYLEGRTLHEALRLSGNQSEAFEKVLLNAGQPFASALSSMEGVDTQPKRAKKRIRASLSSLGETGLLASPLEEARCEQVVPRGLLRQRHAKVH